MRAEAPYGLDRRSLLKTAAASCALFAPGAALAQAQQPAPARANDPKRRIQVMSNGALSAARLRRMHDAMAGYVARGQLPGLVTLVSRRGDTHVDAIGAMALGGGAPMRRDTIFRIASVTKPVTAVAAMILVEEGSCASTTRSTAGCPNSPTARC
jgi:CubicO group peptidase (beta-lactamase class C family)